MKNFKWLLVGIITVGLMAGSGCGKSKSKKKDEEEKQKEVAARLAAQHGVNVSQTNMAPATTPTTTSNTTTTPSQ